LAVSGFVPRGLAKDVQPDDIRHSEKSEGHVIIPSRMMATLGTASSPRLRSLIPARIDRLPWSRFHTHLVMALGVAWILDGLEITIASNVGADLTQKTTLNMSPGAVADIATWYLIGEVIGALFFGQLSDKLGRRPRSW
jgi:hypothetical protein